MNRHRPVYYSANSSAKKAEGHAMVIAGYAEKNGTDYFYCNMGQKSSSPLKNGWYALDGTDPYWCSSCAKGIVVGLYPHKGHHIMSSSIEKTELKSGSIPSITLSGTRMYSYILIDKIPFGNGQYAYLRKAGNFSAATYKYNSRKIMDITSNWSYMPGLQYILIVYGLNIFHVYKGTYGGSYTYYSGWDGKYDDETIAALGASTPQSYNTKNDMRDNLLNNIETTANYNYEIYPNPSDGIFNLNVENGNTVDVHITDATGLLVKQFEVGEHEGTVEVNLSGMQKGVYYAHIIASDSHKVKKIIVK